jgi:hypothetical protein
VSSTGAASSSSPESEQPTATTATISAASTRTKGPVPLLVIAPAWRDRRAEAESAAHWGIDTDAITLVREAVTDAGSALALAAGEPDASTPCEGLTAADVALHLSEVVESFAGSDDGDGLPADRLEAAGELLVSRWRGSPPPEREQWTLLLELVVHSWDITAAVGAEPLTSAPLATAVLGRAMPLLEDYRRRGTFQPPVAAGASGALQKLVRATGRDPHWTGPAPRPRRD